MKNKIINNKIIDLIKKIKYLDYKYFILNENKISDYEYDKLIQKLYYLEKKYPLLIVKNSPTNNICKFISKDLKKVKIITPMLSLKSIYSLDELLININNIKKKINKIEKINYCCEYKLDGLAVNLLYINGKLIYACTRGDGKNGENVSHNIEHIYGIPTNINKNKIPYLIEIRGEVCISYKDFFRINKILKSENKKEFSNPRNASSGLLRQIKYKENYKILKFFAYGVGEVIDKNNIKIIPDSHFQLLKLLNNLGFCFINKYKKYNNINLIINLYKKINLIKKNLKYGVDGIVIKIDSIKLQNKLGLSNKFPNWSIALKFKSEEKITKIIDINYKIGKTGILIPIAKLNPINISGSIIKNAYLNNFNKIINLDLKINDYVLIEKVGDIIPIIKKNLIEMRNLSNIKNIDIPKNCPKCNLELRIIQNKNIKCINYLCKGKIISKIIHFFSHNAIYAKGIGEKTINILFEYININSPLDLFDLNINILKKIPNINDKKASILINSINNCKNTKLYKFIYALGIENIGINTSKIISKNYNNIYNFINEIKTNNTFYIKNINKKKILSIKNFLNNKDNLKLIFNLLNILNFSDKY